MNVNTLFMEAGKPEAQKESWRRLKHQFDVHIGSCSTKKNEFRSMRFTEDQPNGSINVIFHKIHFIKQRNSFEFAFCEIHTVNLLKKRTFFLANFLVKNSGLLLKNSVWNSLCSSGTVQLDANLLGFLKKSESDRLMVHHWWITNDRHDDQKNIRSGKVAVSMEPLHFSPKFKPKTPKSFSKNVERFKAWFVVLQSSPKTKALPKVFHGLAE